MTTSILHQGEGAGIASVIAEKVTLVVMEARDYWKPFYYLLDDAPFKVMLVNARHVNRRAMTTILRPSNLT